MDFCIHLGAASYLKEAEWTEIKMQIFGFILSLIFTKYSICNTSTKVLVMPYNKSHDIKFFVCLPVKTVETI